ncbi:MAG: response regulator transcription factor [Christensenellales bacterium]
MRILIVEDEERLAETLADIISENKGIADICRDGKSGLDSALSNMYDAIILDVMLPGMSGFDVVRRMRESGNLTPVLMLTARAELGDRITGLDSGADYYLTKPFETAELMACLRAILRRGSELKPSEPAFGDLTLLTATGELFCKGRSVRLSAKELELMSLLMANKGILLPKETIYLKIWGYDGEADDSIVEVYISFLRKKIVHIGSIVKISVVRRLGYRLEAGA